MSDEETNPTAPLSVWIGLICIAVVSFWSQATVTEERFVPALNVISLRFKIPDDVAGATLMAAGASSPELFSSFVSLFITHSALGLGTIVGSEIFNQLVICAGAVFAAHNGVLYIDRAIVTREVSFYGLSIILLFVALSDRRPTTDDELGPRHIYVSFFDSALLFGAYILYVWVCSNFEFVLSCFQKAQSVTGTNRGKTYGSTDRFNSLPSELAQPEDIPFLTEMKREPYQNFERDETEEEHISSDRSPNPLLERGISFNNPNRQDSLIATSMRNMLGRFSDGASVRVFEFLVDADKPSNQHDLYDVNENKFDETLSCFLWQRSVFYNKAKFAMNAWHLRWFTFTRDKIISVPDRVNYAKHMITYPKFENIEFDDSRLVVKIVNPHEGKRDYFLMAPSAYVFDLVVKKCEDFIDLRRDEHARAQGDRDEVFEDEHNDEHMEPSLIEFPRGASTLEILIFVVLFPIRLLMHFTIPDVRELSRKGMIAAATSEAFLAAFSCLIWLIVGSYAMVASLESLAKLMDIPDAVVGVTVSAAGTSLPNYVASQVAARQGFGNMAVSNAFGSNTFNILVGLGLPWTIYTALLPRGQEYHTIRDEDITESVIVMAVILMIFVTIVVTTNFVLYVWHGYVFFGLYIAYLAYAIIGMYI